MNEIDKFISDVSKELEEYYDYHYHWDAYERMFDFEGCFGFYENDTFYLYDTHIDELLFNAFNKNPENCMRLLEYIFNKENLEYDFSEIKKYVFDENEMDSFDIPKLSSDKLKIFISYSSKDFEKSKEIYEMFNEAGIDCFLAQQDLKGGVNWNPIILQKLKSCNIFILMLSKNFLNSAWCNQEASIAFLQYELNDATLIPIYLDETRPYGIFYDIQGISYDDFNSLEEFADLIDEDSVSFEDALKKINDKKYDETDEIINELRGSTNFRESNEIFSRLKSKNLSSKQVEDIIGIALVNDQVLYSFNAHPFLSKHIHKFEEKLDSEKVKVIKECLDI